MLLYRPIANHTDYAQLQEDINTISEWVDGSYLQFNTQKRKFMRVTTENELISVLQLCISVLCCQPLQEVDSYKYLGILLSSDLSWTQHIQSTCGKVRKLIGLIYQRYTGVFTNVQTLKAYSKCIFHFVHPHLEYASQLWNPYKAGEINSPEDVQP